MVSHLSLPLSPLTIISVTADTMESDCPAFFIVVDKASPSSSTNSAGIWPTVLFMNSPSNFFALVFISPVTPPPTYLVMSSTALDPMLPRNPSDADMSFSENSLPVISKLIASFVASAIYLSPLDTFPAFIASSNFTGLDMLSSIAFVFLFLLK